jgi:hypothetical protein
MLCFEIITNCIKNIYHLYLIVSLFCSSFKIVQETIIQLKQDINNIVFQTLS